ncbi:MAG: hypothetical protein ACLFV3_06020 [Phycisphaeraceae bacterium]
MTRLSAATLLLPALLALAACDSWHPYEYQEYDGSSYTFDGGYTSDRAEAERIAREHPPHQSDQAAREFEGTLRDARRYQMPSPGEDYWTGD